MVLKIIEDPQRVFGAYTVLFIILEIWTKKIKKYIYSVIHLK